VEAAEAYRLLIADVYQLAAVSRRSSERIAEQAGQSVARWHVLSVLSAAPLTVAAAARRLGLARQSVHRVVNEMVADGLVAASPNPDHKGAPLMSITPAGDRVLAELVRLSDADRSRRLARLGVSADELRRAGRTIRSVLEALKAEDS
jgi:DNA-binding MarR family transcriptional regulator